VLYSHPELYPPTLNAINNLADHFGEVHVLYRPHKKDEWKWPSNVRLHPAGRMESSVAFRQSSFSHRMAMHLLFAMKLLTLLLKLRPGLVLLYDPYPALFYTRIRPLLPLKKHFLWYHNHDVIEEADLKRGDRMIRLLWEAERQVIRMADLFTLPAIERRRYFEVDGFKGQYFTLPNFPSKKVYSTLPHRSIGRQLTVSFQGSICPGRGLEGLIGMMPLTIKGIDLRFSITGFSNNDKYLDALRELKKNMGEEVVALRDPVAYHRLAEALSDGHIGWVYYGMDSSMDHSMGTASNKFFECCALGLPVLYNEENAFKIYKGFKWALPVALTKESITEKLGYIIDNYPALTAAAYEQFSNELNFEHSFRQLLKILPVANREANFA
jgi:hypothetical protein